MERKAAVIGDTRICKHCNEPFVITSTNKSWQCGRCRSKRQCKIDKEARAKGKPLWKPDPTIQHPDRNCTMCGVIFPFDLKKPRNQCKECITKIAREKRQLKRKERLANEIRECIICHDAFSPNVDNPDLKCSKCILAIQNNPNLLNDIRKQKHREEERRRRQKNSEHIREQDRNRRRKKMETDPIFVFKESFRTLFKVSIKQAGIVKGGQSINDILPYTMLEARAYLESLFKPWMNWDNHGRYDPTTWDDNDPTTWTWQIDHIVPRVKFRYSSFKDQDFIDCWALSNLRPLSAKENNADGARRQIVKKAAA
jgi:hypothetical protein